MSDTYEVDGVSKETFATEELEKIEKESYEAAKEIIGEASLKKGNILVVGCSSSEIGGGVIGHESSVDIAKYVYKGIKKATDEAGVFIAAQCCEHLNRAIIIEREALPYAEEVCVVPKPKAGGSWATTVYENAKDPIAVEEIAAHAGLDIGCTLIGMHLKKVAVPVRLQNNHIGEALVLAAKTRPKYIGGERAKYE
ncbi:MAG TPA: TIGR01440 family protein [Eubacterium sp.]|nr:TIGR01440 family protein [Eubacterium sp.]